MHARLLNLVEGRSGKSMRSGSKSRTRKSGLESRLPSWIRFVATPTRRVQQDTLVNRGPKGDLLFWIHRSLQIGTEHLSEKQIDRLNVKLEAEDPKHEVTLAWH